MPTKRHGGRPKKYNAVANASLLAKYEAAKLSHKQGVKAFAAGIGKPIPEVERTLKRARQARKRGSADAH